MDSLFYRTLQIVFMGAIGLAVLLGDLRQRIRFGRGAFRLPDFSRPPVFVNDMLFWIAIAAWVVIGVAWFVVPDSVQRVLPIFGERIVLLLPAGAIVGIIGLVYIIGGLISLGRSFRTSIDFQEKTWLITSGLFQICRNPMALGLLLQGWATALMVQTWPSLAMAVGLHATNRLRVYFEERYLAGVFGGEYEAYCLRTGRFFPRLGNKNSTNPG